MKIYMRSGSLMFAAGVLLAVMPASRAEEITVRAISAKTGHPLVEQHVQLHVVYLLHPPDKNPFFLFNAWQYTDASGSTTFRVPGALPPDASVFVGGIVDNCSPLIYRAEEIEPGVAIANLKGCKHRPLKKFMVQPRPHEVVIYSGEYSRWERALYFPWPD